METGPEKPAFGSPCNGCGFCCAAEQCDISLKVFGDVGAPCPAMQFDDGRFYCGVLRDAPPLAQPLLAYVLGIGRGCDADDPETTTGGATIAQGLKARPGDLHSESTGGGQRES